jgi:iron only hydrogenase large subunit-like protein
MAHDPGAMSHYSWAVAMFDYNIVLLYGNNYLTMAPTTAGAPRRMNVEVNCCNSGNIGTGGGEQQRQDGMRLLQLIDFNLYQQALEIQDEVSMSCYIG